MRPLHRKTTSVEEERGEHLMPAPPEDNRHNEDPEKWCRAPLCRMTNTCGYDRLHLRGPDCPPYDENPAPNPSAEFWEAIREVARQNVRHKHGLT